MQSKSVGKMILNWADGKENQPNCNEKEIGVITGMDQVAGQAKDILDTCTQR